MLVLSQYAAAWLDPKNPPKRYHQSKPVNHPEGARRKCSICPQGFFQNEYGQNECKKCAFGRYQPDTQKTSCLACPAGQYSITPGTRGNLLTGECTPCRRDTYSADEGAISPLACTQCPVGFVSEPGSTECTATDRITTARPDYSRKVRVQYEMGSTGKKTFSANPTATLLRMGSIRFRLSWIRPLILRSQGVR